MTTERASIFGPDDEDLSSFKPKPPAGRAPVPVEQVRQISEAANFRSREPKVAPPPSPPREQRRHRTGRNVQFNIKARAEAIKAFYAINDSQGWVLGETFERAVAALERELKQAR